MRTVTFSVLLLLGGISTFAGAADPVPSAEPKAPLLDQFARAVVYIDLRDADMTALIDMLVPEEARPLLPGLPTVGDLKQTQSTLLNAGIQRVYLVISLADLPWQPWYLLAPCPDSLDPARLLERMPKTEVGPLLRRRGLVARTIVAADSNHWFFVGTEATHNRLQKGTLSVRPELTELGDVAIGIMLIPTDDDRRVVEELLPALPEPLGGGAATVLTRGLQWATIQCSTRPEPLIRVVIQSADAESAEELREVLIRAIVWLNQWPSRTDLTNPAKEPDQVAASLPKPEGKQLIFDLRPSDGSLAAVIALTRRPLARLAIERTANAQLKQIVIGMHSWLHQHKTFPTQANYGPDGKPLLSWRVHTLPFLGEQYAALYREFQLDEPWDSEHNRTLLKRMPDLYAIPGSRVAAEGRTCYVRPVGPDTSCPADKAIAIRDIPDGTSNTVAVIEVDDQHAVPWTQPADLSYDPENPTRGLGGHLEGTVFSAFCDGSRHVLRKLIHDPKRIEDLRRIFTRADCEIADFTE